MARPFVEKAPVVYPNIISVFQDDPFCPVTCPIFLSWGNVHSLERQSQILHVVSGNAWVTFDAQDFILQSGDEITLSPGRDIAVVSALGEQTLVYKIY